MPVCKGRRTEPGHFMLLWEPTLTFATETGNTSYSNTTFPSEKWNLTSAHSRIFRNTIKSLSWFHTEPRTLKNAKEAAPVPNFTCKHRQAWWFSNGHSVTQAENQGSSVIISGLMHSPNCSFFWETDIFNCKLLEDRLCVLTRMVKQNGKYLPGRQELWNLGLTVPLALGSHSVKWDH